MINILIVEDQKESRDILYNIIKGYGSNNEIHIEQASNYDEAVKMLESGKMYSGFFIDINLNIDNEDDISGIEFAKYLRTNRKYEFVPVIMVTSIAAMEMTAFREIHCYQYIVKPYDIQTVEEVVKKIVMHDKVAEDRYIMVKKDGINYKIKCDAIQYIQAVTRGIQIKLTKENIKIPYLTIKKFMTMVEEQDFIQCHRMYVVNKKHIDNIDLVNRMIKLEDGSTVEIGLTYKDSLKEMIND